jgi:hypothetical protein
MRTISNYAAKAVAILNELGVEPGPHGVLGFTDMQLASDGYIHHSRMPVALAAYAAISPVFAAGRLPGYLLRDMVEKVPCMDSGEYAALARACGCAPPNLDSVNARAQIFGEAVWGIVDTYDLHSCFMRFGEKSPSEGDHYNLRPRGIDWAGEWDVIPEDIKALRKAYRAMTPLQKVMVVTIMRLYNQNQDKTFLTGCPTKMLAADAMTLLREKDALSDWGHLVTHYAGW